jgi:4-amino-4-deoxy-L-arabinose transferase-like glycosyltransferase
MQSPPFRGFPWSSLVFLVLLGGVFLRFHALERPSLWDDEMSSIQTISIPRSALLDRFRTYEVHPPLYFLQLRLWRSAFGDTLGALRANSALWGSVSLLLIFLLAKRLGGGTTALAAAALMALSPFHLAYSQELRPYALAAALSTAVYLAVEMGEGKWPRILLAGLWTGLLYTHYWGGFVCAASGIYALASARTPAGRRAVLLAGLAACGAFCFWLPILRDQLRVVEKLVFWAQPASAATLGGALAAYTGLYFKFASSLFMPDGYGWVAACGSGLLALAAIGILKGPRLSRYWLGIGLLLPWMLSFWMPTIFLWYRYPVLMYPAFVLLVIAGIRRMPSAWGRGLLLVLALGTQIWGCRYYFARWEKANPKAVVAYTHALAEADRTATTVVVRPAYFASLYAYYDRGMTRAIDQHTLDSTEKRAALKGKNVILIAFDVPSDPVGEAFRSEFRVLSARHFPGFAHLGITVYHLR